MKIPEAFFVVINPVMKFLLRSPVHWLFSGSIMLITFTGRKSGKRFTTPVRYVETDGVVRSYTAKENQWWRNLRGGADVVLRIRGEDKPYHAVAIHEDPHVVRKWLVHYLEQYPQDAAYHEIRRTPDKHLDPDDLERAVANAVVVEATPVGGARQN
jgi:deazaflavin-dependent oxidoreductase (nitroreductase family)